METSETPLSALGMLDQLPQHSNTVDPQRRAEPAQKKNCGLALKAEHRSRSHVIRQTALQSFFDRRAALTLQSLRISRREWKNLLRWMDIGGVALYFLDRMNELQLTHALPLQVLVRLQENLRDNTMRNHNMIAESVSIQREFQEAQVSYAVLKGFSLFPSSVPALELRHQFDLDFLVSQSTADRASHILENRGFVLYAANEKGWEYKRNVKSGIALKDIYKESLSLFVELHLEASNPGNPQLLLNRIDYKEFYGIRMPVLSPPDLFLGQAIHAYKHVSGEFSRVSHLLEFRRHVANKYDDLAFWANLEEIGSVESRATLGLGLIILLLTKVSGEFAPPALVSWTVDRLPPSARLWVELYSHRVVFDSWPGSKLFLLLKRELGPVATPDKRSLKRLLVPLKLPPTIIRPTSTDTFADTVGRYRMQVQHVFGRLRFHLREAFRFPWELYRWRQHMNRIN
jgi:hypothetical protein